MTEKKALITGYTGQDGTFLTEYLLRLGYTVVGLVRRISTEPPRRVRGKFDFRSYLESGQLVLEEGDLLSPSSLNRIITKHQPLEVYNLAAQSHVGLSFGQPEFTIDTILDGTINLITALESCHKGQWKMYQASTSEMFGDIPGLEVDGHPRKINEFWELSPNSPYAIAKTAAHQYCKMKRKQGHFIACGILFNHESEIRGGDFVTQKIARGVVNWQQNAKHFTLGNLEARRDWGYAGDYVMAMHYMLQHDKPEDFVIATGEAHSIRQFVEAAFGVLGHSVVWDPKGAADDQGYVEVGRVNGKLAVVVDRDLYRPNEVGYLVGDYSKAKEILGWEPQHNFDLVVKKMVTAAKDGFTYEH